MARQAFRDVSGRGDRGTFDRIARAIPFDWVQEALESTGTATIRKRRLPAEQAVWLVLGMALFRDLSIEEVTRELELVLPDGNGRKRVAPSAAIQSRERLGIGPMYELFSRSGRAWAHEAAAKEPWRGHPLYALDGTSWRVPDSKENRTHFGKRENGRSEASYPLVRAATLMAARSHLLVAAELGPYEAESEYRLARPLFDELPGGSVLAVDRGFFMAELLIPLAQRQVDWVTRGRKNTSYEVVEELGPGDWIVELQVRHAARQRDPTLPKTWRARAIRYQRRGFQPQLLFTSLMDAKKYPREELAALYHERWEVELAYDEVKTELLEREEAIRSKKPEGVYQESWGILLAYNLIRLEMARTAALLRVSPVRISFVKSLHFVRQMLRSLAFTSPGAIPKRLAQRREEEPEWFLLPPRRSERSYPRAVKIKMSHYARNRGEHRLN